MKPAKTRKSSWMFAALTVIFVSLLSFAQILKNVVNAEDPPEPTIVTTREEFLDAFSGPAKELIIVDDDIQLGIEDGYDDFTIAAGQTLQINNDYTLSIGTNENEAIIRNSGTIINNGTIYVPQGGVLDNTAGATITNNGTIHMENVRNSSGGTIDNHGTLQITSGNDHNNYGHINNKGTFTISSEGRFVNRSGGGTITNNGGISISGTFENYGPITNEAGGTITVSGTLENLGGSAVIDNFGVFNATNGALIRNSAGIINNKADGVMTLTNATFDNNQNSEFNNETDAVINSNNTGFRNLGGVFNNETGATFNNRGTSSLTNTSTGTINNLGTLYFEIRANFTNLGGGIFNSSPTIAATAAVPVGYVGTAYSSGTIFNVGNIDSNYFDGTMATNLPDGLLINNNNFGAPVIEGTPTAAGVSTFTLTATQTNSGGSFVKDFTIDIEYPSLTINLPATRTGYTILDSSDAQISANSVNVNHGDDFTFKIALATGYTQTAPTVSFNSAPLAATGVTDDVYTYLIENVTVNGAITVTNVALNTHTINLPETRTGYTILDSSDAQISANSVDVNHGDDFTFRIALATGYTQTAPTVSFNSAALVATGVTDDVYTYLIENVTANGAITVLATEDQTNPQNPNPNDNTDSETNSDTESDTTVNFPKTGGYTNSLPYLLTFVSSTLGMAVLSYKKRKNDE